MRGVSLKSFKSGTIVVGGGGNLTAGAKVRDNIGVTVVEGNLSGELGNLEQAIKHHKRECSNELQL